VSNNYTYGIEQDLTPDLK